MTRVTIEDLEEGKQITSDEMKMLQGGMGFNTYSPTSPFGRGGKRLPDGRKGWPNSQGRFRGRTGDVRDFPAEHT